MGFLITILIATVLFGFLPMPVQAASPTACNGYVSDAVSKARDATNLRCGFSGPVWSTDEWGHKRWCLGADPWSVSHEVIERDRAFKKCQSCRNYASDAQRAVQKNLQNKCGFSGPRWNADAEGHFRWCMDLNLGPSRPDSPTWTERDAREAELRKCLSGHTLGKRKRGP